MVWSSYCLVLRCVRTQHRSYSARTTPCVSSLSTFIPFKLRRRRPSNPYRYNYHRQQLGEHQQPLPICLERRSKPSAGFHVIYTYHHCDRHCHHSSHPAFYYGLCRFSSVLCQTSREAERGEVGIFSKADRYMERSEAKRAFV